tara:strand:- start:674 stop:973 length:300 start_codon:yes stop_codon:yes gene_type:complete
MKKKISKDQILKNIYKNIDYFNLSLNKKKKIIKKRNYEIIGKKSKLDSLDLVIFFTQLENSFKKEFKINVKLLDIFFSLNEKKKLKDLNSIIKIIEKQK